MLNRDAAGNAGSGAPAVGATAVSLGGDVVGAAAAFAAVVVCAGFGAMTGGAPTVSSTTGTLAYGSAGAFVFVAAAAVVCAYLSVRTGSRCLTVLRAPCAGVAPRPDFASVGAA